MNPRKQSMDGFVPKRPQRSSLGADAAGTRAAIGHVRGVQQGIDEMRSGRRAIKPAADISHRNGIQPAASLKQNIDESLRAIDENAKPSHRQERKNKRKKKLKVKIISAVVGVIVLVIAGYVAFRLWQTMHRVFGDGNLLNLFSQQKLKEDAYGRSNVLILGSTDDMAGRDGANLTDSMMVLSVNQTKKDVYIYSIPRDLYVQFGRACNSGYAGKINEYFICSADGSGEEAEKQRMDETRKFVGNIFNMDIQYAVHVNTVVIRDAVNAVGGVTVNIASRDPRGVLDATFDDKCRQNRSLCPRGHYLAFPNGPNEMNGDQAMAFSQARGHTPPTYGLEQSNFDREKNQQLVLMALKSKAGSTGTLTDFGKVSSLMEAMGKNLRTNISTKEIQTVMKLAAEIKEPSVHKLSFVEKDNMLMTTGSVGGMSIVKPSAGVDNYSEIQSFLKGEIYGTPLLKEKAKIAVLNGSGVPGAAQKQADKLSELGLKVVHVGNVPGGAKASKNTVYQLPSGKEKPATKSKLEEVYGTPATTESPGYNLNVDAQFIVVVGPGS
ncbi:MAG: LytR family transcriptional regulator [Candidatus Saccharimonas sp.]|nr:MAG: LytR family transcriptional regulator [Candidatus Saccharimonas sp.]